VRVEISSANRDLLVVGAGGEPPDDVELDVAQGLTRLGALVDASVGRDVAVPRVRLAARTGLH
jgi:hypothetical protein